METNLIVNILIVLIAIFSLIWLWRKGYRKQVREILLILVIQAEKAWGRGTGAVKFSEVYNKLPTIVTLLFTRNDILAYSLMLLYHLLYISSFTSPF